MVIKTTRWKPDHCSGCIVDFRWNDDGNDNVNKEHTFQTFVKMCPEHEPISNSHGPRKVWDVINEENARKNKVLKAFVENNDDVAELFTEEDGTSHRRLRPTIEFEYTFGPIDQRDGFSRIIDIEFKSKVDGVKKVITEQDKQLIRTKLRDELGVDDNKVNIR